MCRIWSGFAGLLKEDTINEINCFDKKLRLPLVYPWKRYIASCLFISLFIICIFIPSQAKRDADFLHKLAKQAEEIKDKLEEAEKLIEKVPENEIAKEEAAKLKKIFEEAKQELTEAKNTNDIKKAEERLGSKLKQELAEADNKGQDVYSFLTDDIAKAFQCIFTFDTLNYRINVYKEDNMGDDTNIHVSYNNLLKITNGSYNIDEIDT